MYFYLYIVVLDCGRYSFLFGGDDSLCGINPLRKEWLCVGATAAPGQNQGQTGQQAARYQTGASHSQTLDHWPRSALAWALRTCP